MTERPAPSEAEALVERLRDSAQRVGWYDGNGKWVNDQTLMTEAASLIERQAEERDGWEQMANLRSDRIDALRAEVERLQEAGDGLAFRAGQMVRYAGVGITEADANEILARIKRWHEARALDAGTTPP